MAVVGVGLEHRFAVRERAQQPGDQCGSSGKRCQRDPASRDNHADDGKGGEHDVDGEHAEKEFEPIQFDRP